MNISVDNTSLTVDAVDFGPETLRSYGTDFYITSTGSTGAGPIPMSGKVTLNFTINGTDSYRDNPDTQLPDYGLGVRVTTLVYDPDQRVYLPGAELWNGFLPSGQGISLPMSYSFISGQNYYASISVMRYHGGSGGSWLWIDFELPANLWDGIGMNQDNLGTADDNQNTEFDQGGAGSCSAQGLPTYAVNTSYLNLAVEDTDLAYRSFGHEVRLRRVWNMSSTNTGIFGNGWSFAYESTLLAPANYNTGGVTLNQGSGQVLSYHVTGVDGTGTVTVNYASSTNGRKPILTGHINQATGTGHYTLEDKERKLTSRYDYAEEGSGGYIYRLTSITDRNGNSLTMSYDGSGKLNGLTDASGRATNFTLDGNGRCTQFTTPDGRSAAYQYDPSGCMTRSSDLAGNVSTYAYDAQKYMISMTAAGKTTSFGYGTDSNGRKYVSSVTDAMGKVWSYAFAGSGTQVTEPGGKTRSYGNTRGRTDFFTSQTGASTTRSINSKGLIDYVIGPDSRKTLFEYDANGNMTKLTDPKGNSVSYSYDANWNMTGMTDQMGNFWSYSYDLRNNLVAMTTPLGRATQLTYDAKGRLTGYTLPGGGAYLLGYDTHGNVTSMTDPSGKQTTVAYDAASLNPVTRTDPNGKAWAFQYDSNRRLTRATPPDGGATVYGYDCCALSSITDGNGNTTSLERDALLRTTRRTNPLGKVHTFAYDNLGSLTSVTDPLGRVFSFGYDAAERMTSITNPLGKTVTLFLDSIGNVTGVLNERAKYSSLGYDELGLLAWIRDSQVRTTANITRDAAARVVSVTNARGGGVTFLYDADGRITGKKHNNTLVASYSWSPAGFLSSVADTTGTTTFNRDANGRVTSVAYPDGPTLGLTYDNAGNLVSMTYPDGLTVNYTYDGRNLPTSMSFGAHSLVLGYDQAGNLTAETRSNGVGSTYAYDMAGRLANVAHKKGAAAIADLTYTRNAAGEVVSESGTWPLAPTLSGKKATARYGDADGVTTWGGDFYTYDLDGNLTGIFGSRAFSASYDNENRPTAISLGGSTRNYAYDGLGNRVLAGTAAAPRHLHHDPWGRVAFETNGAGQIVANYLYAGNRLVASGTAAGGFVFLHGDKTGNTLALTDATGAAVAKYAYTPYGGVTRSGQATPYTFVGTNGVMDEGNDLFFMKNRFYDAQTGKFLQRDPLGFAGGFNLYRYVGGNPVTRIDPYGLMGDDVSGGFDRFNQATQSMTPNEKMGMAAIGLGMAIGGLALAAVADTFAVAGAVGAAGEAGSEAVATVNTCGRAARTISSFRARLGQAQSAVEMTEAAAERELFRNTLVAGVDNASPVANEFLWNMFRGTKEFARVISGEFKYISSGVSW